METPRSNPIVIAPSGIGEVLDLGINLGRRNFRRLITVAAWGAIPAYSGYGVAMLAVTDNAPSGEGIAIAALGILGMAVLLVITTIALIRATAHLIDPSVDAGSVEAAYRGAVGPSMALLVMSLALIVVALPLMILFPLGLYVLVRWSMATTALAVEPVGPLHSLRRSWAITRGSWWHTAIILFAASLISGVVSSAFGGVFGAGGTVAGFATGSSVISGILSALSQAAAYVVVEPFAIGVSVVLYYELRARSEGFDLAQRASTSATATTPE